MSFSSLTRFLIFPGFCRRFFSNFARRSVGKTDTFDHRVFIEPSIINNESPKPPQFSPWHNISLHSNNGLYNYINEIPRGTRAKFEIATKEQYNPIKQDVKKGALRYFKYGAIPFNYGALPQTWEDCNEKHPLTGFVGDNDPIDAVEISDSPIGTGEVVRVRVLGVFGLIDEGETDWKLLVIRENHPLFNQIHTVKDLENHFGLHLIHSIRFWFQYYKTTDGKPENQFAMNGEILDSNKAEEIIEETHQSWKKLLNNEIKMNESNKENHLWIPDEINMPIEINQNITDINTSHNNQNNNNNNEHKESLSSSSTASAASKTTMEKKNSKNKKNK